MVNMEKEAIRLRGHHLLCMNITDMTGDPIYNPTFCQNARNYQERLRNSPNQPVEVVPYCGDTCRYCPTWDETDDKCLLYDYQPGANQIDLAVLQGLRLSIGDKMTAGELRRRIRDVHGNKLPTTCLTYCGAMDFLHCQQGLDKLQAEPI